HAFRSARRACASRCAKRIPRDLRAVLALILTNSPAWCAGGTTGIRALITTLENREGDGDAESRREKLRSEQQPAPPSRPDRRRSGGNGQRERSSANLSRRSRKEPHDDSRRQGGRIQLSRGPFTCGHGPDRKRIDRRRYRDAVAGAHSARDRKRRPEGV